MLRNSLEICNITANYAGWKYFLKNIDKVSTLACTEIKRNNVSRIFQLLSNCSIDIKNLSLQLDILVRYGCDFGSFDLILRNCEQLEKLLVKRIYVDSAFFDRLIEHSANTLTFLSVQFYFVGALEKISNLKSRKTLFLHVYRSFTEGTSIYLYLTNLQSLLHLSVKGDMYNYDSNTADSVFFSRFFRNIEVCHYQPLSLLNDRHIRRFFQIGLI